MSLTKANKFNSTGLNFIIVITWLFRQNSKSNYLNWHQFDFAFQRKKMKLLVVFVAIFGLALGSELDRFVGNWKEDQYKREGLADYLYYRGM